MNMSDELDVWDLKVIIWYFLKEAADGASMLKKMEQHSSNFIFLLGEGSTIQASGSEI